MKITNIKLEVKVGLPNYSSKTVAVEATADEGESLDPTGVLKILSKEITDGLAFVDISKMAAAKTNQKPTTTTSESKTEKAKTAFDVLDIL